MPEKAKRLTIHFSVRVSEDEYTAIVAAAEGENRTPASLIRHAIRLYITGKTKGKGKP